MQGRYRLTNFSWSCGELILADDKGWHDVDDIEMRFFFCDKFERAIVGKDLGTGVCGEWIWIVLGSRKRVRGHGRSRGEDARVNAHIGAQRCGCRLGGGDDNFLDGWLLERGIEDAEGAVDGGLNDISVYIFSWIGKRRGNVDNVDDVSQRFVECTVLRDVRDDHEGHSREIGLDRFCGLDLVNGGLPPYGSSDTVAGRESFDECAVADVSRSASQENQFIGT